MKRILLICLALLCAPVGVKAYEVTPLHPRLLLTPTIIDSVRSRIQREPYRTYWGRTLVSVKDAIDNARTADMATLPIVAFALAVAENDADLNGVVTYAQVKNHLEAYLTIALSEGDNHALGFRILGHQVTPACLPTGAVVLDWTWDKIDPTLRDQGLALACDIAFGTAEDGLYPTTSPMTCTTGLNHLMSICGGGALYMPWAIVLYGEGICDPVATDAFEVDRCRYYNWWGPSLDELSSYGAIEGYVGEKFWSMFGVAEILKSSVGEAATDSVVFMQTNGYYWIHRYNPDLWFARNVAKHNIQYSPRGTHSSIFSSYLKNPYSNLWAHLHDIYAAHYDTPYPAYSGSKPFDSRNSWLDLIYYDSSVVPSATADSLSYYDPTGSLVFSRSGWSFGDTSTVVTVGISALPRIADGYVNGHFYISRGNDNLLVNSGKYKSEYDRCYMAYLTSAAARNTILIEKPSELSRWPDKLEGAWKRYSEPTYGGWGDTLIMPNYGDSYYPDKDSADVKWPFTEWPPCSVGGCHGYLGEIVAFADSGSYCYTRVDMGTSYRFKASSVIRELVHVRPSIVIVRDLVARDSTHFVVKAMLHSIERPEFESALSCGTIIEVGRPWKEDLGGVYSVPRIRRFLIERGDSQAQVIILKPASTEGRIRIIGGPNKYGEYWKQNWSPAVTNPVLTSDDTSYEFWLEEPDGVGKNYVPGTSSTTQADIDARNSLAGGSYEAADWRMEMVAPNTGLDVELLSVFVVGSPDQAKATATYSKSEGVVTVTIRQGTKQYVLEFAEAGGLNDVTVTNEW